MIIDKNIESKNDERICSILGIQLSAILGGPLGAFYLMGKNFNALGNQAQAKKNLLYGIILMITCPWK